MEVYGVLFKGFTELGVHATFDVLIWHECYLMPKRLHFLLLQSMCWDTLAGSMLFVAELSISSGLKCFGEGAHLLS